MKRGGKKFNSKQQKVNPSNKNKEAKCGHPGKRSYVDEVTLDQETFRAGDVVYIILDENLLGDGIDEEVDATYICGVCKSGANSKKTMLECDHCLGGFHLSCLDPPLTTIPQGGWVCKSCRLGRAPRWAPTCPRERVLQQQGLSLGRIESMWLDTHTSCHEVCVRWYSLPEETHTGRQSHHITREVFITNLYDDICAESILRKATVISMAEYNKMNGITEDIFICDYEYDLWWQRFRRYVPWDALDPMTPDVDDPELDVSDGEDADATYTMIDALEGEGRYNPGTMEKHQRKRRNVQGGGFIHEHLAVREVPRHIRELNVTDPLAQACRALTLAATPQSLPCRENEHKKVEQFLGGVLANGTA